MDHSSRLIGLAFVVLWTIFRLVRYLKAGSSQRPGPSVPRSAGLGAPPTGPAAVAPSATVSPVGPVSGGVGLAGGLAAVLVWLAGNAAVWSCLFMLPALEQVPVMVRLVAGVLANFYLLYLARTVAASVRGRSGQHPPEGGNPIS